jgi:hypothetical protein
MKVESKSVTLKKYFFTEPSAEIHCYSNAVVKNNKLYVPRNLKTPVNLPSMYESWISKKSRHLKRKKLSRITKKVPYFDKSLLVFDTWGTSSYYHLLIDHIIPVWITREWFKNELNVVNQDFEYFRISDNHYPTEISSANEIFEFFLGKKYTEQVCGHFENLIYGYLFSYRPYHGPNYEKRVYPEYQSYLVKFRANFTQAFEPNVSPSILVPTRKDRDFDFVSDFVIRHKETFNFQFVDFSEMSIQEQIRVCNSAAVMFGSEGAAFANQVFMRDKSLVMPVSNQIERFDFHSQLSESLKFRFNPIALDENGLPVLGESEILRILNDFLHK